MAKTEKVHEIGVLVCLHDQKFSK